MNSQSIQVVKLLLSICFLTLLPGQAQDPKRFSEEVENLQKKYDSLWDPGKETIVFTGSSSIRFWENLGSLFPEQQIVNTGFGGSHTSDLLVYMNDLVLQYRPKKVFIYEGDNDIAFEKHPREILKDTERVIDIIQTANPETEVVLIAAKPSLSRWGFKRKYKSLNRKFRRLCKNNSKLAFADVWEPMLYKRKVREDIFIEDGLHMNDKGYELWFQVIKQYME